jgi:hypothetical protein
MTHLINLPWSDETRHAHHHTRLFEICNANRSGCRQQYVIRGFLTACDKTPRVVDKIQLSFFMVWPTALPVLCRLFIALHAPLPFKTNQ